VISNSPHSGQQTPEDEVERLAQEIGRLIRAVEPERRDDLKDMAFSLVREEMNQGAAAEKATGEVSARPFNPLGFGALIFFLGAGLSFIFGPVGLLLMLGGAFFVTWGLILSWMKG
jgi:hypothetical protein